MNRQDVGSNFSEGSTMQSNRKFHATHFMRLVYEGSILFFCVLGLVLAVALGGYLLDLVFSPH